MEMKKNKNKLLSVIITSFITMATPSIANAIVQQDWPVHDKTVNDQLKAINKQLEMGGQLSKMESQVAQNNVVAANANANQLAILQDQKRVILDSAPTLEKCIATTKSMGLGRANAVVNYNNQVIRRSVGRASNSYGNTNFNAVTQSSVSLQTCKEEDIRDGTNGCKNQAVGKYAGLDESIISLRVNELGKNKVVSYEQAKVADRFIKNMVYGLAPERAPSDMANSSIYEAYRKIWNSRMSTVSTSLAEQLAWHTEISFAPGSSLESMWNSAEMNSVYGQTGEGSSSKPEKPSMAELIEAYVKKDFMFAGATAVEQSSNEVDLLRRLNQKVALSNFMALRQIQLLEHQNNLTASLVSFSDSEFRKEMQQKMQTGR